MSSLHVYLSRVPPPREISVFFSTLGYVLDRVWESDNDVEPDCQFWNWNRHPLSQGGLEMLYFDDRFADNTRFSEYEASVVLQAGLGGSPIDLAMVDITASLLLSRFGGVLHNPQRIDRKFANLFICGLNNTKAPA